MDIFSMYVCMYVWVTFNPVDLAAPFITTSKDVNNFLII